VAKRRLAGMQADLALQRVTLNRQEQLFSSKVNSNQQLDEQRAKSFAGCGPSRLFRTDGRVIADRCQIAVPA
jgi:multidrug resistance efflux pump